MPILTLQFAAGGPVIDVRIGVSIPREQAMVKAGLPVPPLVAARALIDTGASCTCVDPSIITALQLTPKGNVAIYTPSTGNAPHTCTQYDVRVVLVHPTMSFALGALPVIESRLDHQGIQALIGRDILSQCLFVYEGKSAVFSIAF